MSNSDGGSFLGKVIWITGLSGAGKSSLAVETVRLLRNDQKNVVFLDGDELREILGADKHKNVNHNRDKRLELALSYAKLCRTLSSQGFTVVISTISMFREVHLNRENLPNYFEVYLKVPQKELIERDPKNIYSRYYAGRQNIAGLDLDVDEPENPNWSPIFNPNLRRQIWLLNYLIFWEKVRKMRQTKSKSGDFSDLAND